MLGKACIVGLGDAGCHVIDRVMDVLSERPTIAAVNTNAASLEQSSATTRLQIGAVQTGGIGTGGDVEVGRQSAEEGVEQLRGLFSSMNLVILVVGLGGGTGTGGAPVVLETARAAGALTLCIVTLPFSFEGEHRIKVAKEALPRLVGVADVVVVVPNDRLCRSVNATKVPEVFEKVDDVLCNGVCALWQMIAKPGYIKVSLAELRRLVESCGGTCTFGYGAGKGKNKAEQAVNALLDSPLTEQGRVLSRASALLVSIVGGPDLALQDVSTIMDAVSRSVRQGCRVEMGTVVDDSWQGRVTLTVIVAEQRVKPGDLQVMGQAAPGKRQVADAKAEPRSKRAARQRQSKLRFGASGKGRFKDVEPTILDGEDLDIPTFIRRGITIEK